VESVALAAASQGDRTQRMSLQGLGIKPLGSLGCHCLLNQESIPKTQDFDETYSAISEEIIALAT